MWTDNHCHLPAPPEAVDLLDQAQAAGVDRVIDVGTSVASSRTAIAMAEVDPRVWATAGVHPHDAADGLDGLDALLDHPRVVAVGECGLDYHYLHSPVDVQRDAFEAQIRLARRRDLALVIHTRDAWDDTFEILGRVGIPERTVFHCFTGGPDEARRCLDLGASLSFSGIVTFPNADDVRNAAALCPHDRYLVETDSPYLAPVPHRGRRNRPELVSVVGEAVAVARGVSAELAAEQSSANATRVYRLGSA